MIEYQQCGFISGYIKSIIPDLDVLSGYNNQIILHNLSSFKVEQITHQATNTILAPKEKQLIFVLENLLSRGFPTFCSITLEKQLYSKLPNEIMIQEKVIRGNIKFQDSINNNDLKQKWYSSLIDALIVIDKDFDPNSIFGEIESLYNTHNNISVSSEERDFYCKILPGILGKKISQLFQPQRNIETMLPKEIANNYFGQRVDFALETVDLKLIVEIDGAQHNEAAQLQQDTQRRNTLRDNGWTIVELSASEIREGIQSEKEQAIKTIISTSKYLKRVNEKNESEYAEYAERIIQVPIYTARLHKCLLSALKNGKLKLDSGKWYLCIIEENIHFAELAVEDFKEWLTHFCLLYDFSIPDIEYRIIEYIQDFVPKSNEEILIWISLRKKYSTIEKQIILNNDIKNSIYFVTSAFYFSENYKLNSTLPFKYKISKKQQNSLLFFLQSIFRKEKFWEGQTEILKRSLGLKPVIGLLPTGAGKSLTYQLSAILQPGVTLVVDPLRSLMFDQADNLRNYCIENIEFLNSEQTAEQRAQVINDMANGRYQLIFIAPERMQDKNFRNSLNQMMVSFSVPYLVIDEAHCVSEWGHDFRTAYLNLAKTAKKYCKYQNYFPTTLALTGTASYSVLTDVQREIGIDDEEAKIYPKSFERKELIFGLLNTPTANKFDVLNGLMHNQLPDLFNVNKNKFFESNNGDTYSGLIFVPWTNNTFGSQVRDSLQQSLHIPIGFYSGSVPKYFEPRANHIERSIRWNEEKRKVQNDFKNNKFPVLVSTKAFGMGIDKSNVRYTIHYGIPPSLEAFYQEAGRAGRDKNKSHCLIIFSDDNPDLANRYLDASLSAQQLRSMREQGQWPQFGHEGDIHRMLFFHMNAFQGANFEINNLNNLLINNIYPVYHELQNGQDHGIIIARNENSDKAIFRLSILGIVQDYTIDWNANQYNVVLRKLTDEELLENIQVYLSRYKTPDYINNAIIEIKNARGNNTLERCLGYIVRFAYNEIEKKRRMALQTILVVARNASTKPQNERNDFIREQLLSYLEKSVFTELLLEMVQTDDNAKWWEILKMVTDIDLARQLLGGTRRTMESYPDHPGLYILSAFAQLLLPNCNIELVNNDLMTGINFIRLNQNEDQLEETVLDIIDYYQSKVGNLNENFGKMVLDMVPTRKISRALYSSLPVLSKKVILSILLQNIVKFNKHYMGN